MQQDRSSGLHLFVLVAFAVEPLYDLLGRHPTFFTAHRSRADELVALVILVNFVAPALLWVAEGMAARLSFRARPAVHAALVTSLVAVILLPALKRVPVLDGWHLLVAAGAAAAVAAVLYGRFAAARAFVTFLSPAILVFPALFLFHSGASEVFSPYDDAPIAPVEVSSPAPVVMVVFDELSLVSLLDAEGEIDAARYPGFGELAEGATWFRNASVVSDVTERAVPALLTGNVPEEETAPGARQHPQNLFTLLGGTYATSAYESVSHLCPERLCGLAAWERGLPKRLALLLIDSAIVYLHILTPNAMTGSLPPIGQSWLGFATSIGGGEQASERGIERRAANREMWKDRAAVVRRFIASIEPEPAAKLYFLHVLLPHTPFEYLPSGKRYSAGVRPVAGLGADERWDENPTPVLDAYRRYLLQLGFVDRLVGELVARLKATGIWHRVLLVVTADHGVSFRPGDSRRIVTDTNYADIMAVPLFIRTPGQREGGVSDRNVSSADILPTVAAVLGIRLPWPVEGTSVFDESAPERAEKVILSRGRRLVYPARLPGLGETLRRQVRLFGSGSDVSPLFSVGFRRDLIGRRVTELPVDDASSFRLTLDDPSAFTRVDPDRDLLPAEIEGRVETLAGVAGERDVAVSVNGTVRAIAKTFRLTEDGGWRFSTVVPADAFRPGRNEVEAFLIGESGGRVRLSRGGG
jgi:hypothetical protein